MRTESDVITALALPVLATVPFVGGDGVTAKRRLLPGATGGLSLMAALALQLRA